MQQTVKQLSPSQKPAGYTYVNHKKQSIFTDPFIYYLLVYLLFFDAPALAENKERVSVYYAGRRLKMRLSKVNGEETAQCFITPPSFSER